MPPKPQVPPCRICNKAKGGQYKCPVDQVEYCSVVCFKKHKQEGCSTDKAYEAKPLPIVEARVSDEADDGRPRKKLKDLRWPPEPDLGLWNDPLAKDDLKPLRRFEYEALATAPSLRPLLSSPSLLATLSRLSSLPRHAREPSLRLLLGIPALPPSTTYQQTSDPFSTSTKPMPLIPTVSTRGRGGARGMRGGARGARGRGGFGTASERRPMKLVESTPEERREVEELVEGIRAALEGARRERGEVA